MARKEQSSIHFNVNITGAKDIQILTKELPKLIKQFKELEKAQRSYEKSTGKASSSSKSGSNVPSSGDISDRMSKIKLGVAKGDITSVKQLHGHYGQLVQQMNKMERAGKNVGSVQLRAYKLHQKLTQQLRDENEERKESTLLTKQQGDGFNKFQGQMISQQSAMKQSLMSLKSANSQVTKSANATKNASYLLLNTGYLIQDSPYGIRGMANNVSQLAQSYQMLSQRINHLNATQGTNLSVWSELSNLMKGPTGIILLVGSVLPAALEFLNNNWKKITASSKAATSSFEDYMEKIKEFVSLQRELEGGIGEDPLGINKMADQIEHLNSLQLDLSEIDRLEEKIRKSQVDTPYMGKGIVDFLFGLSSDPKVLGSQEAFDQLNEDLDDAKEGMGDLQNIDLDNLNNQLSEMRTSLFLSKQILAGDEGLQIQSQFSGFVEGLIEDLELAQSGLIPDAEQAEKKAEKDIRHFIEVYKGHLQEAYLEGDDSVVAAWRQLIESLRGSLDEETLEMEDPDLELPDLQIEDEILDADLDWSQFWKDQSTKATYAFEDAFTMEDKIQALKDKFDAEQELLEPNDVMGGMANWREYWKGVLKIRERERLFEMNLDAQDIKSGIEDAETWDKRIQEVKNYYDKRREIAREAADDEIDQKERVAEIDKQEENEVTKIKKQETENRKEIVGNYVGTAINMFQALGQNADKQSREQFIIQKIAAASRATYNTYEAITAALASTTLPPGTRIPYAISVGAFGFSQVAKILSQSYDSASSTGKVGGGGGSMVSYRGFDFEQNQRNDFAQGNPYQGSSAVSMSQPSQGNVMPDSVETTITDGFDNIVAKGTIQLKKKNNQDLGLWRS